MIRKICRVLSGIVGFRAWVGRLFPEKLSRVLSGIVGFCRVRVGERLFENVSVFVRYCPVGGDVLAY